MSEIAKMPTVELKIRSNKLTDLIKALLDKFKKNPDNYKLGEISELYSERLSIDLELFDRKIKDINLIK